MALYKPYRLWDVAFDVVASNWHLICEPDEKGAPKRLRGDVRLPWIVCDHLVCYLAERDLLQDNVICILSDPTKTNLKRVKLKNSAITDIAVMALTKQRLLELDIQGCTELSDRCLPDLIKLSSLQALNLSRCPKVLQNYVYIMDFFLPQLVRLDISYTELSSVHLHFLTRHLPKLLSLNVSGVVKNGDMTFLMPHRHRLTTLVLHDCMILETSLQDICRVKSLRHLDISVAEVDYAFHLTPLMLSTLVQSLPHLVYLDLSGNQVDSNRDEDTPPSTEPDGEKMETDMDQGEMDEPVRKKSYWARFCRQFDFLGLLLIDDYLDELVPAKKVASLSCEANILTALETYKERKSFALAAMNAFFDTIRAVDCKQVVACVEAITSIMNFYPGDGQIQIPGSASLFHLSRTNYRIHFTNQTKQIIILALLQAIEKSSNPKSITLLRNCGLTLLNFDIPVDFYFEFERIVKILISVVRTKDAEGLLPRIYVYMCNSIVCHVEGDKKLLVGRLGIIECMLQLIKTGLDKHRYDEVMETAWSALWNVTDETSFNCERFVEGRGLHYFLESLKEFPDKPDLLRNMMGLIGNVAEVPSLRKYLLEHVEVFIKLLHCKSDGIEVSYNAAGTLSHIASDGPLAWIARNISRDEMLRELEAAIDSWDLNSQRNINYRSFQPILRLLSVHHTYQVQLWAAWAIANLCTVSSEKYCQLLWKEDGCAELESLFNRPGTPDKIKQLLSRSINIYKKYLHDTKNTSN